MSAASAPPAELVIRRVRVADDAAALAAMMNDPAVYPGTLQMPFASEALWQERLAALPATDLILVGERAGRLVACAGLHGVGGSPRRRHAMSVGLTVAGEAQGQGVGRAMMQALLVHADRWLGLRRLELTVYADNERAIALYRSLEIGRAHV